MTEIETIEITPANTQNGDISPIPTRTDVLKMLGECIRSVHHKLRRGRSKDIQKDKLKQEMLRVQGYLTSVYLGGLKDLELEELNARILKLETARRRP